MGFSDRTIFLKCKSEAGSIIASKRQLTKEELYQSLLNCFPEGSEERKYLVPSSGPTHILKRNIHFRRLVEELLKDSEISEVYVGKKLPRLLVWRSTEGKETVKNEAIVKGISKHDLLQNALLAIDQKNIGLATLLFEKAKKLGPIQPSPSEHAMTPVEKKVPEVVSEEEQLPDIDEFIRPLRDVLGIVIYKRNGRIIISRKEPGEGKDKTQRQRTVLEGSALTLEEMLGGSFDPKNPMKALLSAMNYPISSIVGDINRVIRIKDNALNCLDAVSLFFDQTYIATYGKPDPVTGKPGRKPYELDPQFYPVFRKALTGLSEGIGMVLDITVQWDKVYAEMYAENQIAAISAGKDQPPIIAVRKPPEKLLEETRRRLRESFSPRRTRPISSEDVLNPASARPLTERGHALLWALKKFVDYHTIAFHHAQIEESPTQWEIDHIRMTRFWSGTLHPLLGPFIVAAAENRIDKLIDTKKEVTRNVVTTAIAGLPKIMPFGESLEEGTAFTR